MTSRRALRAAGTVYGVTLRDLPDVLLEVPADPDALGVAEELDRPAGEARQWRRLRATRRQRELRERWLAEHGVDGSLTEIGRERQRRWPVADGHHRDARGGRDR